MIIYVYFNIAVLSINLWVSTPDEASPSTLDLWHEQVAVHKGRYSIDEDVYKKEV